MQPLIPLTPQKKQAIWGGSSLAAAYGFGAPGEPIAEAWVVSAHPTGDCLIPYGPFAGMTLGALWAARPALFGAAPGADFPLLVKFIDAAQDLSVQVHPDDAYAAANEPPLNGVPCRGKTECWYILDADPGARLVLGHNASDAAALAAAVTAGRWTALLRSVPVRAGDFFAIPAGTIHSIGGGIRLLEVQQSSDITYRLYDYDRLQNGRPRPLHIQKALAVAAAPSQPVTPPSTPLYICPQRGTAALQRLLANDSFRLYRLQLDGEACLPPGPGFAAIVILEGAGDISGMPVKTGEAFIAPQTAGALCWRGRLCAMVVTPA